MKRSLLPVFILFCSLYPTYAQKTWIGSDGWGGDGKWNVSDNWLGGVPENTTTSANRLLLYISGTYTNATANIDIDSGVHAVTREIYHGLGKTAVFNLASGSSFSIGTQSYLGGGTGLIPGSTGTGSSHLSFIGPDSGSATLNFSSFYIGMEAGQGGHSLTMSGNIVVNETSSLFSVIGRRGDGNLWRIENGVDMTRTGLRIAGQEGLKNNRMEVSGAGTRLLVNGGHANRGLALGAVAGTSYANSASGNTLAITNGGKVEVKTGADGSAINSLSIGNADFSRSNSVTVAGAGSLLELRDQTTVTIGNTASTNLGGNSIDIRNGGLMDTNGAITIYDFQQNSGANDGRNRLIIGDQGTLLSTTTITSAGLIRLEAGGVLAGKTTGETTATVTLNINKNGRFEAAGTGLGGTVKARFAQGSAFSVGAAGGTEAEVLHLNSAFEMLTGSVLELSLFDDGSYDQIVLGSNAELKLGAGVLLNLDEAAGLEVADGTIISLFSGNLSAINGTFDLSNLHNRWDVSNFNAAGGWQLVAIPEPGTIGLLLLCGGWLVLSRKKQGRLVG